jgi:hypothetical protein
VNTGPYARIYHTVVDDSRFEGIFDDDHHFATWVRLLLVAEAAWPASATIPRSTRTASIKALVSAGIIELCSSDRFRMHGLDPERQQRSEHARFAAGARWSNAGSNAPGNAQSMPRRDETRKERRAHAPSIDRDDSPDGSSRSIYAPPDTPAPTDRGGRVLSLREAMEQAIAKGAT